VRNRWLAGTLPLLGLLLGPGAARAETRRYALDASASQLVVHVGKSGLLSVAGHEHEVVSGGMHGTVSADPEHLEQASVDVFFDAGALRVTGKGEPPGDVPSVQETMLGPGVLDAGRHPGIHFLSTAVASVRRDGDAVLLDLHGKLSIHGVTREITVPVRVTFDADRLQASGSTKLRQTEFGIKPISKAGVVKVKDELDVSWRLVARSRQGSAVGAAK
jgi:polyisoprenoid-binding protein YceI